MSSGRPFKYWAKCDKDNLEEGINREHKLNNYKMQTDLEKELILLGGLSQRSSDKAEHLQMCQQTSTAGQMRLCVGTSLG